MIQTENQNVTADGGIIKIPIVSQPERKEIKWERGINAKLHYKAFAYLVPGQKEECKHDTDCVHKSHSFCGSDCKGEKDADRMKNKVELMQKLLDSSKITKDEKKETKIELDPNLKPVRQQVSNSRDLQPFPFELRIGYSFSVKAIELCIKTMKIGERARFLCMPEYCDGFSQLESVMRQEKMNRELKEQGKPPINFGGCCAHATPETMEINKGLEDLIQVPLEFEFELIEVQYPESFEKEPWEMTPFEKYKEIPKIKDLGNDFFKKGDYENADKKYERCLVLVESLATTGIVLDLKKEKTEDEKRIKRGLEPEESIIPKDNKIELEKVESMIQSARLNYAICKMKLKDYQSAIQQCAKVLQDDQKCVKALFRRGQCYLEIGRDLDLAQKDFEALKSLMVKGSPEYHQLAQLETLLQRKLKLHAQKERQMFAGKFTLDQLRQAKLKNQRETVIVLRESIAKLPGIAKSAAFGSIQSLTGIMEGSIKKSTSMSFNDPNVKKSNSMLNDSNVRKSNSMLSNEQAKHQGIARSAAYGSAQSLTGKLENIKKSNSMSFTENPDEIHIVQPKDTYCHIPRLEMVQELRGQSAISFNKYDLNQAGIRDSFVKEDLKNDGNQSKKHFETLVLIQSIEKELDGPATNNGEQVLPKEKFNTSSGSKLENYEKQLDMDVDRMENVHDQDSHASQSIVNSVEKKKSLLVESERGANSISNRLKDKAIDSIYGVPSRYTDEGGNSISSSQRDNSNPDDSSKPAPSIASNLEAPKVSNQSQTTSSGIATSSHRK
ncbi:hypothetical protein HDV01_001865 [Terramyces sp. JEL0728]|nr:hypothetical protein HDV01_001865 [Terramyces sp. JEL0728]